MPNYHAILTCSGLTDIEGRSAPKEIEDEFQHRPWHQNVVARWDGTLLWLEADNDYDEDGRALLDEFWDAVIACVKVSGTIEFKIESVSPSD